MTIEFIDPPAERTTEETAGLTLNAATAYLRHRVSVEREASQALATFVEENYAQLIHALEHSAETCEQNVVEIEQQFLARATEQADRAYFRQITKASQDGAKHWRRLAEKLRELYLALPTSDEEDE
jgi:uncharacterized ferritin-like protein (DUF455 family)